MSNDSLTSEPSFTWTNLGSKDDVGGIEVDSLDVGRQITVAKPTEIVIDSSRILESGVVCAIVQRDKSLEYIDVDDPSCSGRPLGILVGNNPGSVLTEADMDGIRTLYGIPESVILRAPNKHERADWDIPGWTCFYENNPRQGFRFHVPSLARRLLVYYDIAPGQLMSNSWRILISLSVLREKYNLPFGIGSLLLNYYLKEHVHEKGRYSLILRSNGKQIITDLITNDHRWKDTFFFAKGLLIDGPFGNEMYAYRRVWNCYELINAESKPRCDDAVSRKQRVLGIPTEKRSWKVLMAEGNLRPSTIWIHSTWNVPRTPYPLMKDLVSQFIISMKFTMPNPEEALRKQREAMAKRRTVALAKKKNVEEASKDKSIIPVVEQPLESSPEMNPLRPPKRWKTVEDKGKGKSIEGGSKGASTLVVRNKADLTSVTFPKEVSVFNEPGSFLKKSNDLLFSIDGDLLKGKTTNGMMDASLISTFQMQLDLKNRHLANRKKCSDLQKAKDSLKRDLESTVREKELVEEKVKALDTELAKSKKEIVDRDQKLANADAMCAARVDLFRQYLAREHTKWDPHAEITDWEEDERFEAEKSPGDGHDRPDTGSKDATAVDSLPLLDVVDPDQPTQDPAQDQANL
ncbi:hypothetical protein Dsin_017565 [Dipteronia sinensis]|uniref:Uncharacterized protein n=1 Tax=Dipteronia sinensis TaxID=43782 RepID=A0AAE0AF89_9ROSI|nr:hypothetical protein Dsin_017565 [Dipteronia sinensis]